MRKPCNTSDCPMYSDKDYDGASTVDSEGVDWYYASCDAIQVYYDYLRNEDDE